MSHEDLRDSQGAASLTTSGLVAGYGRRPVIDGLSFTLRPGVTALLGPNGAGKTTLVRALATVAPPLGGVVNVCGHDVDRRRTLDRARREIGYLPQHFGYTKGMTVEEFVTYGAWVRGIARQTRVSAVEAALHATDLVDRRRQRMGRLSGGMVRRAGLAWAFVGEPRVLLLDEPTVGLDPEQRVQFRAMVAQRAQSSVVLLSTHLADDVELLGGRVLVLADGTVKFDGTSAELAARGSDEPGTPGSCQSPIESGYLSVIRGGRV